MPSIHVGYLGCGTGQGREDITFERQRENNFKRNVSSLRLQNKTGCNVQNSAQENERNLLFGLHIYTLPLKVFKFEYLWLLTPSTFAHRHVSIMDGGKFKSKKAG